MRFLVVQTFCELILQVNKHKRFFLHKDPCRNTDISIIIDIETKENLTTYEDHYLNEASPHMSEICI